MRKHMSLKTAVVMLIVGIILLTVCTIALFPAHFEYLNNASDSLFVNMFDEKMQVRDQEVTTGSVFYLVETNGNAYYLIQAEKSPFFSRYRFHSPIILQPHEKYVTNDYFQEIRISFLDNSLIVDTKKQRPKSLLIIYAWILMVISNIIVAIIDHAKSYKNTM